MNDPSQTNQHLHVWVTGRVQGVGFRAFVANSAQLFGLTGWVRNVGYDTVEAIAEGRRDQLERFLTAVSIGPRASHVDQVRTEWGAVTGEFVSFDVVRSL